MFFSETNGEISKSLVKAWGAIETPKHNTSVTVKLKSGGSYKFDYTDLTGIFEALQAVYKENGLMVMQNAYTEDNFICVETMLLHESGEWLKSKPISAIASKDMQEMGGQVTYMKRYSLSALSGISTEKDDDANFASGNEAQFNQRKPAKASEKQLNYAQKLLKEKVKGEWTYDKVHEHLKQQLGTQNNIENFTSKEASDAIKILQNKQGA